jgi:hypothetical protein
MPQGESKIHKLSISSESLLTIHLTAGRSFRPEEPLAPADILARNHAGPAVAN